MWEKNSQPLNEELGGELKNEHVLMHKMEIISAETSEDNLRDIYWHLMHSTY